MPPSIQMISPVMNPALSEHRNRTIFAISIGFPMRPTGCCNAFANPVCSSGHNGDFLLLLQHRKVSSIIHVHHVSAPPQFRFSGSAPYFNIFPHKQKGVQIACTALLLQIVYCGIILSVHHFPIAVLPGSMTTDFLFCF